MDHRVEGNLCFPIDIMIKLDMMFFEPRDRKRLDAQNVLLDPCLFALG